MPIVKDEEGKVVAEMEYTPKGEAQAEKMVEDNLGYTVTNASERVQNYQFGGLVPGQPGFGQRPVVKPPIGNVGAPLGMYEEGGEVEYKKGGKVKK